MLIEWLLVLVGVLLTVGTGVFVAAEFSLVTVDRATVERRAEEGDRGAVRVLGGLRTLSTQLSGAQLGITLTTLLVGFLVEPSVGRLLQTPLAAIGVPEGAVTGMSIFLALVLATVLQMIVGELVPKNLAIARPLAVARAVVGFQRAFSRSTALLLRALNGSANTIVRALGLEPQEELASARSAEELISLVDRSAREGTLDAGTADLVGRSLVFGDKTAADVLTPRPRVRFLRSSDPLTAVVDATSASGHSRFPVCGENPDDVVGVVHIKHALAVPMADRGTRTCGEVMLAALVVPESLGLDPLLEVLREQGLQLAVVVDEYGGTAGVVTLEDLVEEIVGDIADEHDRLAARSLQRADGSWVLSGLLRPDEVLALSGLALPEDESYETVAGLVTARLGRLPVAGDEVEVLAAPRGTDDDADEEPPAPHRVRLAVMRLEGRRIDRIAMHDLGETSTPAARDE